MESDPQDSQSPSSSPENPGWLQRQWQRLRGRRGHGDTILAQVGEEARHVAVGKNIIQIGALSIPLWLVIVIAAGVVIGASAAVWGNVRLGAQLGGIEDVVLAPTSTPTPTATPLPTPTPARMDGRHFNVAVADFGELDDAGHIQPSALGAELSRLLFTGLQRAVQSDLRQVTQSDLRFVTESDILVWHLGDDQAARQIHTSLIGGETPEARGAHAADVATQIGAQMVVSGYLRVAEDPGSLTLEFFYRPDQQALRNLPDAVGGRHELGQPLEFRVDSPLDPVAVQFDLNTPLRFRADILFWLSLGLIFDAHGQPEQALRIFQAAEERLQGWDNAGGKELLYYLIGRSALNLRRHDDALRAFEAALVINDAYANALMGMGSVHFDRAQLFYLRGRPIPEGVDQCTDASDVARGVETETDALAAIQEALRYFEEARRAAPQAPWPPIAAIADLNLGLAHWLHGQALALEEDAAGAAAQFAQATSYLEGALPAFGGDEQVELLGHAYLGLGVTHFAWGNLRARQQEDAESIHHFGAAFGYLSQCVDLRQADGATNFLQNEIVGCGCTPYREEAERALLERGGGEG